MAASVSLSITDQTVAFWMANGNLDLANTLTRTARHMAQGDPTDALLTFADQINALERNELHWLFTILMYLQEQTKAAMAAPRPEPSETHETADLVAP